MCVCRSVQLWGSGGGVKERERRRPDVTHGKVICGVMKGTVTALKAPRPRSPRTHSQANKTRTHSKFPLPPGLHSPHWRVIKMHAARRGPASDWQTGRGEQPKRRTRAGEAPRPLWNDKVSRVSAYISAVDQRGTTGRRQAARRMTYWSRPLKRKMGGLCSDIDQVLMGEKQQPMCQ